ncbi:hypothetical protein [Paraburkholderia monticola]|uniref:hypothetical protein n=1 Tax=Paraburkholderia monticola TaxID=1399968 RepID=UPI00129029F4|nr:hypothetical protein [Paraburkholderia monticola]
MKRVFIGFSALFLSGCLSIGSIHGTSEVLQRPSAPVSNLGVVYIQAALTAKRGGLPTKSPVPLLQKDGYYQIADEIKRVTPDVARERGIQATVSVGGESSIPRLPYRPGSHDAAQRAATKELVLFVKGGHLDVRGVESDFIFHAIFRDASTGTEYWHSDYRILDGRFPDQIALNGAKIRTLLSQIFDDLQKEGFVMPPVSS